MKYYTDMFVPRSEDKLNITSRQTKKTENKNDT